jgi:hypothetical protein
MPQADLTLALGAAMRLRGSVRSPFAAVFANRATLHELVHEARRREEGEAHASGARARRAPCARGGADAARATPTPVDDQIEFLEDLGPLHGPLADVLAELRRKRDFAASQNVPLDRCRETPGDWRDRRGDGP